MFKILVMVVAAAMASGGYAYEWDNVGPDRRLGGRMISAGYLRGKVVLLDRRDYTDPANAEAIRQLQTLWATYKSKPFILLASQHGAVSREKMAQALKQLGVTYPVYADARLTKPDATEEELEAMAKAFADTRPSLVILDSTCRRKLYSGRDMRVAQGVVGGAILAASVPTSPRQYDFLLDWELRNLPGRAYVRLKEYRARFPQDAAKYADDWQTLAARDEIRQLAKLVELSRMIKDRDVASASARRLTPEILERAMEKYAPLKQSADAFVAQEAKNALADIRFSEATLGS
ncbi:MAG: peroxiredoxin family protein [Kiritimatiellia bacterium]